jgi:prepilin-type N-terminal cleavage/methylation domain-containing protein
MKNRDKGFTLVELLIVMVMFIFVIMAASSSFNVLLTQMAKITKSEESNIEGVVGLEMMRHDLQQAGFGLYDSYITDNPANFAQYIEATVNPAISLNDAPSGVPRAVAAIDNAAVSNIVDGVNSYNILSRTDYLTLKGLSLGLNDASQKWTYMPYSSGFTGKQKPRIWMTNNLTNTNDRVVVIKKHIVGNKPVNQLVYDVDVPDIYWVNYNSNGFVDAFMPTMHGETFYIYGLRTNGGIGMPFNRSDYFVARPSATDSMPNFCAPNTGILYKATVNHEGGALRPIPLLDCVADMQIVFGWDLVDSMGAEGQDGVIDTYSSPVSATGALTVTPSVNLTLVQEALGNPEKIRNGLKIVKINILAQVGRIDRNYTSPPSFIVGDVGQKSLTDRGEATSTQFVGQYELKPGMSNYRWKVYRLIVRPKNLLGNQ